MQFKILTDKGVPCTDAHIQN